MSNYTKEQMIKAVDSFPDTLRGMLFSPDTERKVQKIGLEAGLLIGQLRELNGIANFAILGLLVEKDIEAEIKNSFAASDIQAKEIAEKISTEILNPISELKVKALAEQRAEEEKERIDKDNEARLVAEKKEYNEAMAEEVSELSSQQGVPNEYSSEAPFAPENLPIEKDVELSFIKLTPKIPATDSEPVHPFEEKMKMAFTATSTELGNIPLPPPEATPTPAPTNSPNTPPAPLTGTLRHDPYREAIE